MCGVVSPLLHVPLCLTQV